MVKYVYKASNKYFSSLAHAKRALKMDGWTPTTAKKAGIKIVKYVAGERGSRKPGRLISTHKL